jgi:hypothetical protein
MYQAGRYRIKTGIAVLGGSRKSGSPQIELPITIIAYYDEHRQLVPFDNDPPGRTVYLSLTEATLGTPDQPGWVTALLTDLGFVGPSFADLGPLAGHTRDATLRFENYNGQDQEKWTVWPESRQATQLDDRTVRQLDMQHAALLRSIAKNKPASRPAPQPKPAPIATNGTPLPAQSDEDIPF